MNGKKMWIDFCSTALPGILTAVIGGLTYVSFNFKDYLDEL